MIKLPYGISDFHRIRSDHYLYLDRTTMLSELEDAGRQLLFLRPHRFGKSLLHWGLNESSGNSYKTSLTLLHSEKPLEPHHHPFPDPGTLLLPQGFRVPLQVCLRQFSGHDPAQ